jgi:signal peptidase II
MNMSGVPKSACAIAITVLILDQITKTLAVSALTAQSMVVTPFFNLVLVWNRGISFGMFNEGSAYGAYLLSALSLIIVGFFITWLRKIDHKPLQIAICTVIAGALGNVIDRLIYGAVVDFLDFHAFGYHWPAFNIADSAVVLGIAFIICDSIFFEPKRKGSQDNE